MNENHELKVSAVVQAGNVRKVGDCRCGWGSPVCGSEGRVRELYLLHVQQAEEARQRELLRAAELENRAAELEAPAAPRSELHRAGL